ncbi:MAG: oligoendopeptidase F [Pirellulaceae bacterium]|nr:oligoendopeptidase F [Pirellulaceae bacterium]
MAEVLIERSQVALEDQWDLGTLFENDKEWEVAFEKWEGQIETFATFQGRLGEGAAVLKEALDFECSFDLQGERLGAYAFLNSATNQLDDRYQRLVARFQSVATRAAQAASFMQPELLSLHEEVYEGYVAAEELAEYRLLLKRMRRYKDHTLTENEERLLAMQGEMAGSVGKAFRQLLDSDMKFGTLEIEEGKEVELSNATFSQFLYSPNREVRKKAFHQYYQQFVDHENTLSAMLAGSIHKDVYYARARNYPSALEKSLFPDNVPMSVYDNLIKSVRTSLPAVHDYYELRREKLDVEKLHMYDTYVPLVSEIKQEHSWDEAVELVVEACAPLGKEYCQVMQQGLSGRWCDRYPNKGKQSGAFSYGVYQADPYIMMNYKPTVLDDVFTLAHEAGHSMHSHYSCKEQPYHYCHYTIFVAEVASTFNEELLHHSLLSKANDRQLEAYLLNREIDGIRATVVRQTMFAEFEKTVHAMAEGGEPLTVASLKDVYRQLVVDYFGEGFAIDEELPLECLRIPHFYRAYYVYKYATGMSAAIALSQKVLNGGQADVEDYLSFLKGGCSQYPLDLLRGAGVDMEQPQPVETALGYFGQLVGQLRERLV